MGEEWNSESMGPSKNYQELDLDGFMRALQTETVERGREVVLSLYSDNCGLCQQIKEAQESAAEAVKKEYTNVTFYRYFEFERVFRFG